MDELIQCLFVIVFFFALISYGREKHLQEELFNDIDNSQCDSESERIESKI